MAGSGGVKVYCALRNDDSCAGEVKKMDILDLLRFEFNCAGYCYQSSCFDRISAPVDVLQSAELK